MTKESEKEEFILRLIATGWTEKEAIEEYLKIQKDKEKEKPPLVFINVLMSFKW